MNVTYHSRHGAVRESMHVFIDAGLNQSVGNIRVLEMGFGTGLNALLTSIAAEQQQRGIHYETIEAFPLSPGEIAALNYCERLQRTDLLQVFQQMHQCDWAKPVIITPYFTLQKHGGTLLDFVSDQQFDLVYFDAFAPGAQPELWTMEVFTKLYKMMKPKGILVTYCSKGDVRRAMQSAGFAVEKIPGPPGKREMVRAIKK